MLCSAQLCEHHLGQSYYTIEVLDAVTGRGVPMVHHIYTAVPKLVI